MLKKIGIERIQMKLTKKAFFTLIFIAAALNGGIVEKTYSFNADDTEIYKTAEGYDLLKIKNTLNTAPAGEPAMPYQAVSLLLPPGEKAVSVEIIPSGKITLKNKLNIYPQQHSQPVSKGPSGVFVKNESVYKSNTVYPYSKHGELTTHYLNGHSFALTAFSPAEYDPVSGETSVFETVKVRITTAQDERSAPVLKNLSMSENVISKIKDLDDNGGSILNTYQAFSNPKAEGDYDYLIITGDAFKRNFDVLTNFYASRGLSTKVVSVNTIYSGTTGTDNPEKIRNFIISEYQNYGIEFVLLAGDVEVVPARGFYCSVQSSSVYTDDNIPSDIYYSALDGSWNNNGDALWAEIGEDDLLPELSVTRFSVSDTTELNNMINKTVKYQSEPVTGKLRNPLMAGEKLYDDPETWGADYLELLIGYREDNGYNTQGIPEDHNITRLYDKNAVWSKLELIAEINEGHSFIHHDGHSNFTYNMRMSNTDVTNSNFSTLNGITNNYTLVSSSGCMSGGFDYDDCIAERFTVIENLAVAYVGNSRYGWFNEGQTEGPSIHLHREFNDALYGGRISNIGTAHKESKIDTAPWVNAPGQWEEGALRWCFYDCNVLGDAALNIWTDEPENITASYNNVITIGQADFELNIKGSYNQPLTKVLCAVIQNGTVIGKAYTDELGNAFIAIDPIITTGAASLVVSGYNTLRTEYPLDVIANEGKYIAIDSYRILSGGDEMIEYGESASISLTLKNAGLTDAAGLEMTLSVEDDFITLTGGTLLLGAISAGDTLKIDAAFTLNVADNVPDLHNFTLNSVITDTVEQWTRTLNMTAAAAALEIVEVSVNDGGDSMLDPGETAGLVLAYKNTGHAAARNLAGTLSSDDPMITVNSPLQNISAIPAGETGYMTYNITASAKASNGYVAEFSNSVAGDSSFLFEDTFFFKIGTQTEDFETGDFSAFNWYFEGDEPWGIDDANFYEGTYSARSGDIGDNQTSTLAISDEVLIDGDITFYVKTSTEVYFDPLVFYIDGAEIARWDDGETDWTFFSYPVTAGAHTFKWSYEKDEIESGGQDFVWVDYITFPGIKDPTSIEEDENSIPLTAALYQNYPNPFNPETVITYALNGKGKVDLAVYNLRGEVVSRLVNDVQSPGKYSVTFNAQNLNSGIYFYRLQMNGIIVSSKRMLLVK
jgi:hypothetical protein